LSSDFGEIDGTLRCTKPEYAISNLEQPPHHSFLIGFIEEITYRGFILQKFEERYGFWIANPLSSLLFLIIHLPGWISLRLLSTENVLSVFIFGVAMAIVFKYCKSLWGTIITHSLNDFISYGIFHL
jgi:membrane protease YdiL (CAAX protease family)